MRSPGTAKLRLYRPGDGSGLGAAVQIVNDDMPMLVDSVTSALRRIGASVVAVLHPCSTSFATGTEMSARSPR